jgi:predicted amidophosphoribosyltransferase
VRKAIDELAAENLLVRRQGKGTFVATHSEDRAQFRFLRLLADDGAEHPHVSKLLECRRLRATAPQTGLDFAARRRNVRGAFTVVRPPGVDHVAVLDDVMTTGATVGALAAALKRAGVARVDVWALCRAAR